MAQFPSLPLWTDAYLADTAHLTDAEHGIYLQLLMMIWRAPQCRIPNDDKWLARHFRRPVESVEKEIRPVIKEFCRNNGNHITQGRLLDEWNYMKNKSKNQSDRAKSRWNKEKDQCPDDAPPHQLGNAPIPTLPSSKKDSPLISSPRKKKRMGKRLEISWAPSDDDLAFASERGYAGKQLADMIENFREYFTNGKGRNETRPGWSLSWQTWIRNQRGGQQNAKPTPDELQQRVRAAMGRNLATGDGTPEDGNPASPGNGKDGQPKLAATSEPGENGSGLDEPIPVFSQHGH